MSPVPLALGLLLPLFFVSGYLLGGWHNQRWRPSALAAEAVARPETSLSRLFVPPLPPEIILTGWIHP